MDKLDLSSCVIQESEEQKKPVQLVINAPSEFPELVSVRISTETKRALEALAKKYKVTVSEVIRQLTDQGIELVNREK